MQKGLDDPLKSRGQYRRDDVLLSAPKSKSG
jgi:hypothetical protein